MENNWVDDLVSDAVLNPLSKQPEIVKEAFVLESDAAAFQDVDEQLAACKERKAQIESAIKSGVATPGEKEELAELNREINELLDYHNLKRREIYTPHLAATNLSPAEQEAAIQEYPKLADTCSDVKAALQVLFPTMAEEDYRTVRAAYWESVFNGPMVHTADLEGMYEVGAGQLGAIVDDVMEFEGNKEERLENYHKITNAELKEEILARSALVTTAGWVVEMSSSDYGNETFKYATEEEARAGLQRLKDKIESLNDGIDREFSIHEASSDKTAIHDSDDMKHRDPESRFQDTHLNQSGPHTSGPGMVEMAEGEAGLNGYICFWRGKQFEVYAKTSYEAQQKCAKEHGIKKSYEIRVELAEKGGEPVIHQPQDIAGSADAPDKLDYGLVMDMSKEQLAELPTLAQGQFSNLKFDDGKHRVWLSRMTVEDGAQEDHAIEFEVLQNGVWRQASKKVKADFWIRDPKDPNNLIRVAPVDEPATKAEPVFEAFTEPPKPAKGPATKNEPVENAFSESDFGFGNAETVQESPAPMPASKPAAVPAKPAPEPEQTAPAAPEAPAGEPDKDELQKMVDLKVEWKMLSESIEKHVTSFREKLVEEMAKMSPLTSNPIEMKKQVSEQDKALKNALAMVDGMARTSQGFKVFLQQISGSHRFQSGNAWDTLRDNAAIITEAGTMADQRLYNAMIEMEQNMMFQTYVKPSENIGVIPEKENKPSRVKKSTSLNWSGLEVEAAPVTQKMKEYYAGFVNWCKRTLLPLLTGASKSFESLQEAMNTVTSAANTKE